MIPPLSRSTPTPVLVVLALLLTGCLGGSEATPSSTSRRIQSTTTSQLTTTTSAVSSPTTTDVTTSSQPLDLGDELVFNGDFAAGSGSGTPAGWELTAPGEGQRAELVTEGGDTHVSLFAPASQTDVWPEARSQPFPVSPHTEYRLQADGRTFTQGRLFLALMFLDEDGDEILLRGIGSPQVEASEWTFVEGSIESSVSAAAAQVVLRLAVLDGTPADSLAIDVNSVSVREVFGR